MVGFGGVAISHVGAITRKRSVSFYDSEVGTLQMKLTLPFISEWHVAHSYSGPTPEGRTHRFAGIKELSYLHPKHFKPDRAKAVAAGFDPEQDNFFVRLVGWGAAHDLGKTGLSGHDLERLIPYLETRGRVHLSVEGDVPTDFRHLRVEGDPLRAHHLMAFSRLYIGESASMAAEAAVLGTPGFFVAGFELGYVKELEAAGLLEQQTKLDSLFPAIDAVLQLDPGVFTERRDAFVAQRVDVAEYVISVITGR